MPEMKDGCIKPSRGPILPESVQAIESGVAHAEEDFTVLARVGKEAIDFEADAFIAGEGFKPIRLSDYKGKWIVLFFYPGDFTFV